MKRVLIVTALAVALVLVAAVPASAASGGFCQLSGTASFSPGLTNTAANFTYSFGGSLSQCQSNVSGAPATGTVEAGKVVTDPSGEQFQEPVPTGNGSCANGTTQGTSISTWADGTTTVISYTTTAVTGAVNLQGTVVPSVTLPAINPQIGQPTSKTITSTRYAGQQVQGALTFQPADPTACSAAGVTSAAINGGVGIGSAS